MAEKKTAPRAAASASIWGMRILVIVSVLTAVIMALLKAPRLPWAVLVAVLCILLSGVNRLRLRYRFKTLHGVARRKKPEAGPLVESTPKKK